MATTLELNIARKKLLDSLGEESKAYFFHLKQWFRRKITKEEFDAEARKIIAIENIHLHNEFLLAVLNKCQSWASTHASKEMNSSTHPPSKLKKGKAKKKSRPIRATFEHRFQPVNPLHCVPPVVAKDVCEDGRVTFCVRENTLPDQAMIYGRMFVIAWDSGLDAVEDEAVSFVLAAVENHLKSILMAIFSRRHAFKLRENRYVYGIGSVLPSPYLLNSKRLSDCTSQSYATSISASGEHVPSIKWTSVELEAESMLGYTCGPFNAPVLRPVSLYDVYEALQVRRNVIPSHSVYSVNMERIAARMQHPTHEELEQDQLSQHESEIRQQLISQQ